MDNIALRTKLPQESHMNKGTRTYISWMIALVIWEIIHNKLPFLR